MRVCAFGCKALIFAPRHAIMKCLLTSVLVVRKWMHWAKSLILCVHQIVPNTLMDTAVCLAVRELLKCLMPAFSVWMTPPSATHNHHASLTTKIMSVDPLAVSLIAMNVTLMTAPAWKAANGKSMSGIMLTVSQAGVFLNAAEEMGAMLV